MNHRCLLFCAIAFLSSGSFVARAQESTVYATVVKSGIYIVGSNNAPSGLFCQHPSDDTVWMHKGPANTRGYSTDVPKAFNGAVQYVAGGNGLFKVEENGTRWRVTTDWRITEVLDAATPDSDAAAVYIATAYGVYYSNDGARTWHTSQQPDLKPQYTSKLIIDRANERRILCASYDGAFVSEDGAATWKKLEGLTVHGILVIRQHPTDPSILAAGTEDNGLYMSRDGGATWKKCEAGIDHSTFYAIAFDPQHPDIMYAGGYVTGVYKSADGGATWRRMNEGLKDLNIHSIAVDPRESRRIYAATLGDGVYRTEDGGETWRSAGLSGAQIWDVKILDR